MKVTICRHCSTKVLPTAAGECPSCRKPIKGSEEIEVSDLGVLTQLTSPTDHQVAPAAGTAKPAILRNRQWHIVLLAICGLGTLFIWLRSPIGSEYVGNVYTGGYYIAPDSDRLAFLCAEMEKSRSPRQTLLIYEQTIKRADGGSRSTLKQLQEIHDELSAFINRSILFRSLYSAPLLLLAAWSGRRLLKCRPKAIPTLQA
jgi:hypothetical protein